MGIGCDLSCYFERGGFAASQRTSQYERNPVARHLDRRTLNWSRVGHSEGLNQGSDNRKAEERPENTFLRLKARFGA